MIRIVNPRHARSADDRGVKLMRFAIADKDRKWVWAEARIEKDAVVCTHPDVPN